MSLQPVSIIPSKGVNRHTDPALLENTEAYSTQNMVVQGGALQARPGADFSLALDTDIALGAQNHWLVSPILKLWPSTITPDGKHYGAVMSMWKAHTGTGFLSLLVKFDPTTGVATGNFGYNGSGSGMLCKPQSFNVQGNMYFVGSGWADQTGVSAEYPMLKLVSGGTLSLYDWSVGQAIQTSPSVACVYRDRVVYGGFYVSGASGDAIRDYVVFSDHHLPNVIGANAVSAGGRAFEVGNYLEDGRMVAMVNIMQTSVGSPSESAVLVLRERAAYIITGEPNESTDVVDVDHPILGDLVISKISVACGCASAETIVHTPYGLIWASTDQVWIFPEGQVPRPVGLNISDELRATPNWSRHSWHAVYFDGYYRLAVTDASQTTIFSTYPYPQANVWSGFGNVSSANTSVPCTRQWWLDLHSGGPRGDEDARWFGPMVYAFDCGGTSAMAVAPPKYAAATTNQAPVLYCVSTDEDNDPTILVDGPVPSCLYVLNPTTELAKDDIGSGSTKANVTCSLVTKQFFFGDPGANINVMGAEVTMRPTVDMGTARTVTVKAYYPDINNTGSYYSMSNGVNAGVVADPAAPAYPFSSLGFTMASGGRPTFKTVQLEFGVDLGGWDIVQALVWVADIPRRAFPTI